MNSRLEQTIATIATIAARRPSEPLHVLQSRSSHATGAILLHAWVADEPHPRVVVKTPRDPRRAHGLRREWDAVMLMLGQESLLDTVPAPIATFELDGVEHFAYRGQPGSTMSSWARRRVLMPRRRMLERFAAQALEVAVRLHGTDSRPARPDEVALDLLVDLAWLEASVPSLPTELSSNARAAAATIAESVHPLPYGRVHGDFTPHNLMTEAIAAPARAVLIDWEHTEPQRPQHLDVFRFMFVCTLMGLRGSARADAFEAVNAPDNPLLASLFQPWLQHMEVLAADYWLQPRPLEALWWHFWIHAARREQERLGHLASSREAMSLHSLAAFIDR